MSILLSVNKISKSFTQRGVVLNELSVDVNEGDSIAVMGPSGSGKTTLLNILGLLERPDAGEVIFREKQISGYNENDAAFYRNSYIGFVFQDHLLLPYLTVKENIYLPLLAFPGNNDSENEEHIDRLIINTGITDLLNKYPYQISGGEAQRVSLVRALANKPSVLLADEPTGSLDAGNAGILGNLLADLNRTTGLTIILATHSADLAGKMSKLFHLEEGKLKEYAR